MRVTKITRTALGVGTVALSTVVLAACGSSGSPASTGTGPSTSPTATSGQMTHSTSIGTVASDASGRTLYELVGNTTASPKCTGTCLSVWPPATASGTQIVLQGHPAYTFSGDAAAGQVTGQAVKDQWGTWYALDGSGNPITTTAATSTPTATTSKGSGYGY